MLSVDMHIHSVVSGHSVSTVDEIVRYARRKKMTHIGITEHGPSMEGGPHQNYFYLSELLPSQFAELKVFFGCEANIIDTKGKLDLTDELLHKQQIIIAGIHQNTPFPPNLGRRLNTQAIVRSMQSNCVSIISHPINPIFPVDSNDLVCAATDNNVILELNTQVMKRGLDSFSMKEYANLINLARKHETKLIINSDAHAHYFIGDDFILTKLRNILGLSNDDLLNFNHKLLEQVLEAHRHY